MDTTQILWGLARIHLQHPELHIDFSLVEAYAVRFRCACLDTNGAERQLWGQVQHIVFSLG